MTQTLKTLSLTNKQFDVLNDILLDTIDYLEDDLTSYYDKNGNEIEEKIEDYEVYKIYKQLTQITHTKWNYQWKIQSKSYTLLCNRQQILLKSETY